MDKNDKKDLPENVELVKKQASLIEMTFESFGIPMQITEANIISDSFEYRAKIAIGHKVTDILALEKDIAFAVASPTGKVEMTAPIPGTALLGIKIPRSTKAKSSIPPGKYKIIKTEVETPAPSSIDQIRTGLFKLILFIGNLFGRLAYWIKPAKKVN